MKGLAGGLAVLVFAMLALPLLLLLRRGLDAEVIGALDDELGEAGMDGHTSLEGGGAPLSGSCSDMVGDGEDRLKMLGCSCIVIGRFHAVLVLLADAAAG